MSPLDPKDLPNPSAPASPLSGDQTSQVNEPPRQPGLPTPSSPRDPANIQPAAPPVLTSGAPPVLEPSHLSTSRQSHQIGSEQTPRQVPQQGIGHSPPLIPPTATTPSTPAILAGSPAIQPAPQLGASTESVAVPNYDRTGSNHETRQIFEDAMREIGKIFVGQEELVTVSLVALFSGGHVLIEGVPGLGKTLFVRTLGKVLGCQFGRIQFTADLMPSDITGAPILDLKTQDFKFRPGPVFTQFLLADEINRSPAKTHAALLEIMQEYRVTIDGVSHPVPRPFLVMATQNPIESEGTYSLPEAQLDRFMFKSIVSYPGEAEEARILDLHSRQVDLGKVLDSDIREVTNSETVQKLIVRNSQVTVEPRLLNYINKIVRSTRTWPNFHLGASPRAGLAMVQGARTLAAFRGRDFATPDDVVEIAIPSLRHRVVMSAEAEVEGLSVDSELVSLLRGIEVPRL